MRATHEVRTMPPSRNTSRLLAILCAAALPALAGAAASARQELQQATRATPNLEHGEELFLQCVSCHGGNGAGQTSGSTPRIAGQHYSVLLKQLVDFRYGKRWDFRMEEKADRHHLETPQDIADVAAFVSQLDAGAERGIGDGTHATDGALIFGARCAACHGPSGQGNDKGAVPRLGGQHYSYLVRQMYDAVDGRRQNLLRVHAQKIEPLDFEQVRAVADYLSRIGWTASEKTDPAP
jgi:cytochrome c553